jgi:hypothetical protein
MERFLIAVLVRNQLGVLNRVTSMFRRRQFNISSLTVSEAESSAYSRITLQAVGEESAKSTVRPYYLELPIHIGYRYDLGGGNVGIFGSFGPYVAMGLFGTDKVTVGSTSTKPDTFSDERLKRFDFGVGLRAGVAMFDHYRIYVGYDWGLINIAQDSDNKINNRNFYVGASYMF